MIGQNIVSLMATPDVVRPEICGSWLTEHNIAMIYGTRGCGKSTIAMGLALAASGGFSYLMADWKPEKKYRVAYFDSEMGAESLKLKFRQVDQANSTAIHKNQLQIITPKDMGGRPWNLSDKQYQTKIFELMESFDVLILDNLLGLTRRFMKGDTDEIVWQRFEELIIPLRNSGKAILLLHHTSKSGDQYGTILKENVCDSVLKLEPVKDESVNGISMNMHFTKGRWIYGDKLKSLRLNYINSDYGQRWECKTLEDANRDKAHQMLKLGLKKNDVAELLKMNPSELEYMLKASPIYHSTTTKTGCYDSMDIF